MKTAAKKHRTHNPNIRIYRRPYPNAAEPSYYVNKVIDIMLAVATGMGSVTALVFMATM